MADSKQPDFDRLSDIPVLFRMLNSGEKTPFGDAVNAKLAPVVAQFQAGKLSEDSLRQAAATATLEQIHAYMGGQLPDQGAAEEYANSRRKSAAPAYGVKGDPTQGAPSYFGDTYNLVGQLQEMAGSKVAKKDPALPPDRAEMTPAAAAPKGVTGPAGSTEIFAPEPPKTGNWAGLPEPRTDDDKLTDTQLSLLYQLAGRLPFEGSQIRVPKPQPAPPPMEFEGSKIEVPVPPPEQQLMDAYKYGSFQDWAMGQKGGEMPLPPGWVRSPTGVPVTTPDEAADPTLDREAREKAVWENMSRMLRKDVE